mgnify:CR=1 FL=1
MAEDPQAGIPPIAEERSFSGGGMPTIFRAARRGMGSAGVRIGSVAIALGVLSLVTVGIAPAAQAHAYLGDTYPADGESLDVAPDELRLDFTEGVVLTATTIDIVDGEGAHLTPVSITLDATEPNDLRRPVVIVAALPNLPPSSYRVSWQSLSSDDLHRTAGVFSFGVGVAVAPVGNTDEAPYPGEAAARWLMWLGLAGVLGPVAVAALAHGSLHGRRRSRLLWLVRGAAAGLLVSCLALPAFQLRSFDDSLLAWTNPTFLPAWGGRVAASLVLLLLAGAAIRPVRHSQLWMLKMVAFGAAALAVPVLSAWRGHLGTTGSPVLVTAGAVHILSGALWAGAVVALAVAHAGRRTAVEPRPVIGAPAFAALSFSALSLAVASGFVLAGHGVATSTALVQSLYGQTIVAKCALLLVVLVVAAINHRRGRLDQVVGATGRRPIVIEAGLLLALLGFAGVLAATAPASSPQWRPAPEPSAPISAQADDLVIGLNVSPNLAGDTFVTVSALQTRRPAPSPISAVDVTMTRSGFPVQSGQATAQPDGSWVLPVSLPVAGTWAIAVTATRDGLPDAVTTADWVVAGGLHGPPGFALETAARWLALLVIVGWLLIGLLAARRGAPAHTIDEVLAPMFGRPPPAVSQDTPSDTSGTSTGAEPTVT